jgi:endo-1,4-beta-xylanase
MFPTGQSQSVAKECACWFCAEKLVCGNESVSIPSMPTSNQTMKTNKPCLSTILALLMAASFALAISSHAALVILPAESGIAGSDFTNGVDGTTRYISVLTDSIDDLFPGNDKRVATFNVTFPKAGVYDLYAKLRVGPNGADDDSLFYANGFGAKSPSNGDDWIKVNNLFSGGFTATNDVVAGIGDAGAEVWKWVNLTSFTNDMGGTPITFTVPPDKLTQTFQIGGRENGLDISKLVFGTSGTALTVAELEGGIALPPKTTPPPAKAEADSKTTK